VSAREAAWICTIVASSMLQGRLADCAVILCAGSVTLEMAANARQRFGARRRPLGVGGSS